MTKTDLQLPTLIFSLTHFSTSFFLFIGILCSHSAIFASPTLSQGKFQLSTSAAAVCQKTKISEKKEEKGLKAHNERDNVASNTPVNFLL